MTALKAEALVREFHYNGIRISDPGSDLTVEQVRDLLTPQFPGIAAASVSGCASQDTGPSVGTDLKLCIDFGSATIAPRTRIAISDASHLPLRDRPRH
jgi:PRTRC genetic system protein C